MILRVYNDSSIDKVPSHLLPIINSVIAAYTSVIDSKYIHNIRLMGSVPRGDAIEYHSDIDFIALTYQKPSPVQYQEIATTAIELKNNHKSVSRVDLEIVTIDCLGIGREFILNTDSITIFGNDTYTKEYVDIDSVELAKNNTPNLTNLLSDYAQRIATSDNLEDIHKVSRWIGKDILKSLRQRLILEKGIYEKSIHKLLFAMIQNFSEDADLFNDLYDVYCHPTDDKDHLHRLLLSVKEVSAKYVTSH